MNVRLNDLRSLIKEMVAGERIVSANPLIQQGSRPPKGKVELKAALSKAVDDAPEGQESKIMDAFTDAISDVHDEEGTEGMKSKNSAQKRVEEVIRLAVRKELRRMSEARRSKNDPTNPWAGQRGYGGGAPEGGAEFDKIGKELGLSTRGAMRAVDAALAKAQAFGQLFEPDERDEIVDDAIEQYIGRLEKTGELTTDDVEVLRSHPDIVSELDGFREFLHGVIKKAVKQKKIEKGMNPGEYD